MKVVNIHERIIPLNIRALEPILASLSTDNDKLWPYEKWPRMELDGFPEEGARGGHGPIKYYLKSYKAGEKAVFKFLAPSEFSGTHSFELCRIDENSTLIRHAILMNIRGKGLVSWPLIIRPLHDALLEDAFDKVENILTGTNKNRHWSWWVKFLRWLLKPRK